MSIETIMSVGAGRVAPWVNCGIDVREAPDSATALKLANLDWIVKAEPLFLDDKTKLSGYRANIRTSDNKVMGITSEKYSLVQNHEAFAFTDALIGGDVRYETAGCLHNNKVWMLARLPETKILDEDFGNFVCFTNSFDGTGSIRCIVTPIRIACQNSLSLALRTAKRSFSLKHMGCRIEDKLEEARSCLGLADNYMNALSRQADMYAHTKVDNDGIKAFVEELFPITAEMTPREVANVKNVRDTWAVAYLMPDIEKYRNTLYGLLQASSDIATHSQPLRMTKHFEENRWDKLLNGHPVIDNTVKILDRILVNA